MLQKTGTLLAFLLVSMVLQAQINFRVGPDIGYGAWGLGQTDYFTNSYISYNENIGPGVSGVFGLSGRWQFGKHWVLQHGLDYQNTQQHRDGIYSYNYAYPNGTTASYVTQRRLHTLVMPVTWGFALGRRFQTSFHMGARFGYVVSGKEDVHSEYLDWPAWEQKPEPVNETVSLFNGLTGNRIIVQGLWSLQFEWAQKYALNFNLAIGPKSNSTGGSSFVASRAMPYLGFSCRPFGKVLKAAPATAEMEQEKPKFETGLEVGYALPIELGKTVATYTDYGNTTLHHSPIFSPVLGWMWRAKLNGHLRLEGGLQYQFGGRRYDLERVFPGQPNDYYYKEKGVMQTHKLCIPLAVGYSWDAGKLQPYVSLGVRANYLAFRREKYKYASYYENEIGEETYWDYERKGISAMARYRLRLQGMVKVGTPIGRNLELALCYAAGNGYGSEVEILQSRVINHDLLLTMSWRFGKGNPPF